MKRLLYILFLCFCIIHAQDYKITFFGLPAVDVNMDMDENRINFSVQTVGLINLIWPTENQYTVTYHSSHFGLLNYEKKIKQGTNKSKLDQISPNDTKSIQIVPYELNLSNIS